jgi:hypothetical protein
MMGMALSLPPGEYCLHWRPEIDEVLVGRVGQRAPVRGTTHPGYEGLDYRACGGMLPPIGICLPLTPSNPLLRDF